ncbi:hypothetical protein ACRE_042850 [Hapsidospora chrysogenum ATCC 11550]|uniref:Aminoglycoside phosphotransferase domain-containing protein n=1 Tax=Hapsidospora chrysogenum (strain ATCC 11550 / CBS 779.69 / DSM 880 / IAM 14645 / JCM 23072 / IMI 49137) TaxID=857340 RepID=A0A086T6G3_HAPC1|nr:hypothetical protein ACRE_042850 [Hapsidospora chrysogenum ATCC 11550]
MPNPASLKTVLDEIEEANGDDEATAWLNRAFGVKEELGTFVATLRGRGEVTEHVGFLKGSFNFCFRYKFSDGGPDALIRFPKPGHIAASLRDEKLANEVQVMELLRGKTTIPIPKILGWGLSSEDPFDLGPFIVMEYVEGKNLCKVLEVPRDEKDPPMLNTDLDDAMLDTIYRQVAGYLLQLSRLSFNRIGAISNDGGEWSVSKRPLTINMNELASATGYPMDRFPTSPFDRASDYFHSLSQQHLTHLRTQRNLSNDPDMARAQFIARHRFPQLIPEYCIQDSGPFLLYCDDLRPANMLVDPETYKITAVLDFEFTNAMPAQFTYDPPWWLLLSGPDHWLEKDAVPEYREVYVHRLGQFLRAMEQAEEEDSAASAAGEAQNGEVAAAPRLSARMRESWESGRFFFDFGLGIRFDRDAAWNYNVRMGTITVTGAGSHAVEVWNVDGLDINAVLARDVGECGLLIQTSTNVWVGYVEGINVAAGNGYATLRFANNNGQLNGVYTTTNVWVDRVYSRGGGRGIFCVSMSGAAEIKHIDLADNGNNAILIENCYNLAIRDGVINGGGEVRVAARSEFPNTSGIFVEVEVNNNSVRESPCAENIFWGITGNAAVNVC